MSTPPGFYDVIPDGGPVEEEKEKPRKYECPSLPDFVEHFLAMFPKWRSKDLVWCREWYEHAEAVNRLQALHDSWEHVRLEPSSMSAWIRDHADYHMSILTSSAGPFHACEMGDPTTPSVHRADPPPLPMKRPPVGMFEVYGDDE